MAIKESDAFLTYQDTDSKKNSSGSIYQQKAFHYLKNMEDRLEFTVRQNEPGTKSDFLIDSPYASIAVDVKALNIPYFEEIIDQNIESYSICDSHTKSPYYGLTRTLNTVVEEALKAEKCLTIGQSRSRVLMKVIDAPICPSLLPQLAYITDFLNTQLIPHLHNRGMEPCHISKVCFLLTGLPTEEFREQDICDFNVTNLVEGGVIDKLALLAFKNKK